MRGLAPTCLAHAASVRGSPGSARSASVIRRTRGSLGSGRCSGATAASASSSRISAASRVRRRARPRRLDARQDQLAQQRRDVDHAARRRQGRRDRRGEIERAHRDRGRAADLVLGRGRHPHRALRRHHPGAARRGHGHHPRARIDQLMPGVTVARDVVPLWIVVGIGADLGVSGFVSSGTFIGSMSQERRCVIGYVAGVDLSSPRGPDVPAAVVLEPGARLRPFLPADLPDGGAGARAGLGHVLRRGARVRHRRIRHLRPRHAAGRLARRSLEPDPPDDDLLCRHRRMRRS